jgi:hypothetical protein
MKAKILLIAATAMALAPALASAAPGGRSSTSQGSTNGAGWIHSNGPTTTGQPGVECGEDGPTPGHAADARGSAFNHEDGIAGSVYAGEQPQNSRNSASVSQYDAACANQPG